MIVIGRLVGVCRLALIIATVAAVSACGGGGGSSGGGAVTTDLHLSSSSVAFSAFASEPASETKSVQIIWSSPRVAGVAIGVPTGQTLPSWLGVSTQGNSSPVTLFLTRTVNGNIPGPYSATIRVVSGDINANPIETVDLAVSLEVVAMPTVSPNPVNLSWVESEQPASRQLTATHDSRVQLAGSSVDVNWLDLSSNGDTLTIAGNAQSQSRMPGPLSGNLTATFSFGGRQSNVTVPIAATVTKALSGPGQISPEVNASTTGAGLAGLSATIATATQAAVPFTASTGVPWLTAGSGTTGSPNNLALTLQSSQLSSMANGTYTATIIITTATPNISSLQIPVSLNLRLPEVHFVAPVAFSDTTASDTVIVRGQGFNDPNAVLKLAGNTVNSPTLVNDTEIRFIPGARTAGTYEAEVTNQLGFTRGKANLRVADPPTYATTSLDAAIGFQTRVISSPINSAVFTQKCFFCTINLSIAGTPSTVQRFAFDSAGGTWTRTEQAYTNLYDIALTPDESSLIVLTDAQLLLVNPSTMATTKTVPLPSTFSGISRQLAVMNNGLVIIHALNKAYSLRTDSFVPISGLISNGGIQASRDGSRAIFGTPINPPFSDAYRYYDASTGTVVISGTNQHYASGAYSRHAEKALVNNLVVDASLALFGTSLPIFSSAADISPDGNRVYGLDFGTNATPPPLRAFNVSGTSFTELTPISLTGLSGLAQVAFDPRGNALFVVSEGKFFVLDLR